MLANYPVFVKRDVDGFFGLFVDNLVQLLLIPVQLCADCAASRRFQPCMFAVYPPGAAVSILVGNVFYAGQALGSHAPPNAAT